MAGRRAKIGVTCIVFGILWIPITVIWLPVEFRKSLPGEIELGVMCLMPILLLLGGLVSFLMDDD